MAAAPGDLYLICSDGLTDIVRDEQIAELIQAADHDPDAAAEALVAAANRAGGIDNITVVLFEIIEGDPVPPAPRARGRARARRGHDGAGNGARRGRRRRRREPEAVPVRRHGAGAGGRWLALAGDRPRARGRRVGHLVEPRAVSARNKELLNLGFAAIVASAAFASVSIVGTGLVSARWLGYVGVIFGLYLVAHVVARFTVPYADPTLLPLVGLLTALGLTVIYRLGPEDARRQAVWVAVGIGVLAATLIWLRFDYRVLERYKYLFGISAVVLLLLPSVPGLGHRVNGVKLWVKVGPMQFQPGELAKIFLIIFLAGYLRDKREALARGRLKDLGPLLVIWGAAMLVLVQTSDLGSALLNFGIFLAMVYAATGRALYVGVGIVLFVGGAAALYNALDRVQQRVTVWLHPWTDERVYCSISGKLDYRQNCDSYQLVKSLYSIANGGYGGTGLGKGTFTTVDGTQLIPYLNTDFIYSAIAQELGLIGAAGDAPAHHGDRGPRDADRADRPGRVLEAPRRRAHVRARAADVHHRRRRAPRRAADRASRCRSSRTAARRSCRTSSCSACSCSSRTVPRRRRCTREPADRTHRRARDGAARGADRRDDVLADVGPPRARRAAGQRDPARGPVPDQARADPLARRGCSPATRSASVGGRTFYFRRYPQGRLAAHVVGYSTAARSRTGLERSLNPAS